MNGSGKPKPVKLGEIAVEMQFVSREDLETLLNKKKEGTSFVGIGERLVFKGFITRPQLEILLSEQARRLGAEGDRLFGQIAIDLGLVSSCAVDNALQDQRDRKAKGLQTPIGMILVERELMTTTDVEQVLAMQVEGIQGGGDKGSSARKKDC
ncbi:MAG: hypothetical protein ACYTFG_01005 [Planctomycetota bacterium]|jgi:hypothetical protein